MYTYSNPWQLVRKGHAHCEGGASKFRIRQAIGINKKAVLTVNALINLYGMPTQIVGGQTLKFVSKVSFVQD